MWELVVEYWREVGLHFVLKPEARTLFRLPPQCAALNRNRCNQDELVVKGALEGNRKAIEQAVALDPLTASVLTLDEIKAMVDELFAAQREEIADFA